MNVIKCYKQEQTVANSPFRIEAKAPNAMKENIVSTVSQDLSLVRPLLKAHLV